MFVETLLVNTRSHLCCPSCLMDHFWQQIIDAFVTRGLLSTYTMPLKLPRCVSSWMLSGRQLTVTRGTVYYILK